MRWTQRIFERLIHWWWGPPLEIFVELPPSAPLPPPPAEPEPQPEPVTPEGWESDTSFHFQEDILDQLDRYMVFIRRMKKTDPDAYEMYHRVGATIVPPRACFYASTELSARWRAGFRGGFGCVALGLHNGDDENEEGNAPRFAYYRRLDKTPMSIEPVVGGSVYVMTVYFDETKRRKGVISDICIHVDEMGHMRLLRMLEVSLKQIRHRRRRPGESRTSVVPTGSARLVIPSFYVQWAKQHDLEPQDFFTSIFAMITEFEERPGMVRVAASKDHLTASFTVDIERMPRFFVDRDASFNERGHKKRIFHIVRAHTRKGKAVRISFRGQRRFTWNGYRVNITVPGLHHNDIANYQGAAHYLADDEPIPNKGYVGSARLARTIARHLDA